MATALLLIVLSIGSPIAAFRINRERLRAGVPRFFKIREITAGGRGQSHPDYPIRSPAKRPLPARRGRLGLPDFGFGAGWRIGGPPRGDQG